jgi:hypothetical protein
LDGNKKAAQGIAPPFLLPGEMGSNSVAQDTGLNQQG